MKEQLPREPCGALIPVTVLVQQISWVLDAHMHDSKLKRPTILLTLLELLKPAVQCMAQTGTSVVQRGAKLDW